MKRPTPDAPYTGLNRLLKSRAVQTILDKLDDGTLREFFEDWKWIFSYSRRYKGAILFYLVLGLFSSTLGLGASVVSKYLVDIVVNKRFEQLGLLAGAMVGSTVFSLVFSSLVSRLSAKISIRVNNDIQADIFARILDAQWQALSQYENGDLLNRFNSDVNTVASNAVNWLPGLVINLYTFAATFCVLLYYDVTMALLALASAPFLLLASRYLVRRTREYRRRVLELNSGMMSFETETFYNFDTIKGFGAADLYRKKLATWQEKYKEYNLDYNLFSIKTGIATSLLSTLVSLAAFGYCLFRLWTDAITYGTMTLFLQQRSALSSNFNSLVGILPGMLNSAVSAHRVRQIVQLPKERHDPAAAARLEALAEGGLAVELRNVDFGYTEARPVVRQVNFAARPGEIVALVGPSGEGKTTLLRLLLGLVQPGQGQAVLVAKNGEETPVTADTRRMFSLVPQGNTLLSGTVAENLRLADENATDEALLAALETACAGEFMARMGGLNAPLGERGRGLSEGQAQRVAIARALLRRAPVLLLDEATSALDVQTERRVLQGIVHSGPGRTCIVSTHRPSVLELCQRVYQIKDGQLRLLNAEEVRALAREE